MAGQLPAIAHPLGAPQQGLSGILHYRCPADLPASALSVHVRCGRRRAGFPELEQFASFLLAVSALSALAHGLPPFWPC
jgi:hypothetical protein